MTTIGHLRTPETQARYEADLASGKAGKLWDMPSLYEFNLFRIINNDYPHDKIAAVHHMLIPKRIVKHFYELTLEELSEFLQIDRELSNKYHCIKRNYPALISVPEILHWHLYQLKEVI